MAGAGLGAGEAYSSNDKLRQSVHALEAKPNRGYGDTMNLAQLRARQTVGDFAETHPKTMIGMGALSGALLGATQGPATVHQVRRTAATLGSIGRSLITMIRR